MWRWRSREWVISPRKGGSRPKDAPVLNRNEQKTGEQRGHHHAAGLFPSDLHINEEEEGGRREKVLQRQEHSSESEVLLEGSSPQT